MKRMTLRVRNQTNGKILADRARQATSFLSRLVGLLGRRDLAMGEGLLIAPCGSIHTFFMRFSIDVLFLDSAGRILKACPSLPAWRTRGPYRGCRSVLELPAGVIAASGTQEGDQLQLEPLLEQSVTSESLTGSNGLA